MIPKMTTDEVDRALPGVRGWSSDILPCYREWAKELPNGGRFVELGVYHGRSLLFMAQELVELGKSAEVWGVDTFVDDYTDWPCFLRNLTTKISPVAIDMIRVVRCSTPIAARLFDDWSVDHVFVDADHTSPGVDRDLEAWLPKVKSGGIISGHDYAGGFPDVVRAVDRLVGPTEHFDSVWWRRI
jgi:cephalosporin hydroxylase